MIPADVEAFVLRNFPSCDVPQALQILDRAVDQTDSRAKPRLLRCAAIASGNTLSGLKYQVDGLAIDYRDVILAAEYIRQKGEFVRVRDFFQPISDDA